MTIGVPIIFVWIGNSLPHYLHDSFYLAKKYNPHSEVILLTNCRSITASEIFTHISVDIESLPQLNLSQKYQNSKRSRFWLYTSLRFSVLYNFLKKSNIKSCFHAELDNIVFSLDALSDKLDQIAFGMFAPRDSLFRGIASLVYINKIEVLKILVETFNLNHIDNDMEALGYCQYTYPNLFLSLPTESYANNPSWTVLPPNICGGIFDAASMGQYLFGVDPKNLPYQPCQNGFVNENTLIDFTQSKFSVNHDHLIFNHCNNDYPLRIYNIHLHSKSFKPFFNQSLLIKIVTDLNNGKFTYMTHKYRILLSYLYKIFRISKRTCANLTMRVKSILKRLLKSQQTSKLNHLPINSFPYVSGDTFASLAGVLFTSKSQYIASGRFDNTNIVFTCSEITNDPNYLAELSKFQKIIVHNGDIPISSESIRFLRSKNISIFAVNVQDDIPNSLFTIPIGLENAWMDNNGSLSYYNCLNFPCLDISKNNLILVSFNQSTNPGIRGKYLSVCQKYGFNNQIYSTNTYRRVLLRSKFVLSPPGNGIDCHRTWEAFYHRTIPVIEKKYYLFSNHKLPVLLVDDIEEFFLMSPDKMNEVYSSIMSSNYPAIFFDYWSNFLLSH